MNNQTTPISFDEMRKIEFDVLKFFAKFCDEKGLDYGLGYGTLIGAIRHKGFIPWDDDVDVNMKRCDYDVLIKTFNDYAINSPYRLISPYDKGAKHSFVKIIDTRTIKIEDGIKYKDFYYGIDIDVFPVDGTPDDEEEYKSWFNKLKSIYQKHYLSVQAIEGKFITKLKIFVKKALLLLTFNTKNRILKKAKRLHDLYPYDKSKFVREAECAYSYDGGRIEKTYFDDAVSVDFEGEKFKAFSGYHQILTAIYGDYMKLPPKEQQITHHKNNVFWK